MLSLGSYQFDHFDPQAQTKEIQRLEYKTQILQTVEKQIWHRAGLTDGMTVLDLGCGPGQVSKALAQALPHGTVVGIDRSPTLVQQAESSRQQTQLTNLRFQVSHSESLDLPAASCDFVYARFVFQHLPQPAITLKEIQRVLKPGGMLCIVDIDSDWVMFYPPVPQMAEFQAQIQQSQQRQGGDRRVGRQMGGYLATAGFSAVNTTIEVITSDFCLAGQPLGLKAFLDLFSFGVAYQSDCPSAASLGAQVKAEAAQLLTLPYAWAGFGLFVVTGRRA
jgi:ubiquinone/menaquinone biosynthesis C-methylase UbiE